MLELCNKYQTIFDIAIWTILYGGLLEIRGKEKFNTCALLGYPKSKIIHSLTSQLCYNDINRLLLSSNYNTERVFSPDIQLLLRLSCTYGNYPHNVMYFT